MEGKNIKFSSIKDIKISIMIFEIGKKNYLGIFWVPFSSEMDKSMLVEVGNDGDGSPMYIAR